MRYTLFLLALLMLAGQPVWAETAASTETAISEAMDSVAAPAPVPAPAAEPATDVEAQPAEDGTSQWQTILATIITILGTLATKWFRTKALAEAKKNEEEAAVAGQDKKTKIVARAKGYMWRRVAELQELELPELAGAVVQGKMSMDAVKLRLRSIGDKLLNETVEYFDKQDIDLVTEFGSDQLKSWIRSAVDEASVFQKWPTAKVLVEGGAEAILAVGVNKAGDYYDELRTKLVKGEAPAAGLEAKIADKVSAGIENLF